MEKPRPSYLTVCSTDGKFMCLLIDWLNKQDVQKDSTVIRVHDTDPHEEIDQLKEAIDRLREAILLI
jgi:hypothetical protein